MTNHQKSICDPQPNARPDAPEGGLYVYCVARLAGGRYPHHYHATNGSSRPGAAGGAGAAGHDFGPIGLDSQSAYVIADEKLELCAVVHNCPASPYQSKLPEVVQSWVLAHQNVVNAAAELFGTVLPMAFDMIVRGGEESRNSEFEIRNVELKRTPESMNPESETPNSEFPIPNSPTGALRAWLAQNRERFTGLLDRLTGKAEYGVQIFWDRQLVAAALVGGPPQGDPELRRMQEELKAGGQPKGQAYLLQQKLAKAIRAAMEREADRLALDFYTRVRKCVLDVRVEKLKAAPVVSDQCSVASEEPACGDRPIVGNQIEELTTDHRERPTDSPSDNQMLLNLSCLISVDGGANHYISRSGTPDTGVGALGRVLDVIQETSGISVRFTGPWPPYSFVGG